MHRTRIILMAVMEARCSHPAARGGTGAAPARSWTVLEGGAAERLREPCSREFPEGLTGHWTPGARDVAEAEAALDGLMTEEFQKRPWMKPQGDYLRQYGGFERRGQRVIYVNAAANGTDTWRSAAIDVCDGGAMSFGAVFDLTTHRFDWFQTNGPYNGRNLPPSR
jgi:hypothetical protein